MKAFRSLAIALTVATSLLSGCASIVSGQNQSVSVATTVQGGPIVGAQCTLVNDKGQWFTATPGSVTVRRSYADLTITCQHSGSVGAMQAKSMTKGMAFGNLLFGGVIGAGVDISTGAAYDYPDLITIAMLPPGVALPAIASAAPLPPTGMATPVPPSEPAASQVVLLGAPPAAAAAFTASPPVSAAPAEPASPSVAPPALTSAATLVVAPPAVPAAKPAAIVATAGVVVGQDSFSAERLARHEACHAQPVAKLSAKGPGFETYSVVCSNADALMIRCEFGNCRVLR